MSWIEVVALLALAFSQAKPISTAQHGEYTRLVVMVSGDRIEHPAYNCGHRRPGNDECTRAGFFTSGDLLPVQRVRSGVDGNTWIEVPMTTAHVGARSYEPTTLVWVRFRYDSSMISLTRKETE